MRILVESEVKVLVDSPRMISLPSILYESIVLILAKLQLFAEALHAELLPWQREVAKPEELLALGWLEPNSPNELVDLPHIRLHGEELDVITPELRGLYLLFGVLLVLFCTHIFLVLSAELQANFIKYVVP